MFLGCWRGRPSTGVAKGAGEKEGVLRDEVGILTPKSSLNQGHPWELFGKGALSLAGQASFHVQVRELVGRQT